MKKVSSVFFLFLMILIFCSCSESTKIPDIVTNINSNAVVQYGSTEYDCHITRLTDGVISVSINSPENLSGLTFRRADGKYSVSYDELLCRTDSVFLPETSFPTLIIDILSAVGDKEKTVYCSSENNLVTFSVNSKSGNFNIVTDSDGNISKIIQESSGLKVIFEKQKQ